MYLKLFFSIVAIGLSALPIINILNRDSFESSVIKNLYSTDYLDKKINPYLIQNGISPEPGDVIIGKDGWLFLGDRHDNTLSASRIGSNTPKVAQTSHEIVENQKKWLDYYLENNVDDFKILVAPNKSTIYSQNMPQWAQPQSSSISEHLYKDNNIYLDLRPDLFADSALLYFRTDTHWNFYAAGIAFNKLINSLESKEKLTTPPPNWTQLGDVVPCASGDLARFLKIENPPQDTVSFSGINRLNSQFTHTIYDYENNSVVYEGTDPVFGNPHHPYLIHTPKSLNNKKVLWLSDSFGVAMTKHMTSTFSHVLKQHWKDVVASPRLENIIEKWQPDYVFVTVVERACLAEEFNERAPGSVELD
ncbi:alginate O-acetyltransferase AlgX-related protein [Rubritalea tangerina]|uniref:AlgX/AlgJ SGNH hydrolase-like domain-containing protein n=1 Tax=Rubritalea tangerina TaxID=430798 RepID=A0ABW4ZBZ3_9BACT